MDVQTTKVKTVWGECKSLGVHSKDQECHKVKLLHHLCISNIIGPDVISSKLNADQSKHAIKLNTLSVLFAGCLCLSVCIGVPVCGSVCVFQTLRGLCGEGPLFISVSPCPAEKEISVNAFPPYSFTRPCSSQWHVCATGRRFCNECM